MIEISGGEATEFWTSVVDATFRGGYTGGQPLVIPKNLEDGSHTPHPAETDGMLVRHVGELKGQLADWRCSIDGSDQGFHVVEFADCYQCHMDAKDPFKDPVGHLVEDSPGTLAVVGAVAAIGVLAALAYALSRNG